MGLAGPKKRTKLAHDPNNTTWATSTTRFGHKVLTAQGWAPGSTLGRPDSEYAQHYTAASSTHVRVTLKDDNKGIGFSRNAASDETFGLRLLSGLLGRLNGKSDAVLHKEKEAMRDIALRTYQENKWGRIGFVSAGFLVGDDIMKKEEAEKVEAIAVKKRKREDELVQKSKRSKKEKKARVTMPDASTPTESADSAMPEDTENEAKSQRKAEKRARKEARRLKREKKAAKKASKMECTSERDNTSSKNTDLSQCAHERERGGADTPVSAPSGASTPLFAPRGRHAIRQKYIQQKRMAWADEKSLNEIFMVKSKA